MNNNCKSNTLVSVQCVKKTFLIMRLSIIFLFSALFASAASSYSQTARFSMELENVTLKQVFHEIEKSSQFIIVYSDDMVDVSQIVSIQAENITVEEVLKQALAKTNLTFKISDRQIAITKKPALELKPSEQQKKTISGLVNDSEGNPLPGVTVYLKGTTMGTVTDFEGKFSLDVPSSAETLVFSFVGFQTQEVEIGTQTLFNISLREDILQLDEDRVRSSAKI